MQDVAAAARFYVEVLGAQELRRHPSQTPGDAPDGAVELRLGDAHVIVARENPRWREAPRPDWPRSPQAAGAATAFMTLYVDDVDAVLAKALAAGATTQTPRQAPEDAHWGDRVIQLHDPAGHVWRLQTRLEDVAFEELPDRLEAMRVARRAARATSPG